MLTGSYIASRVVRALGLTGSSVTLKRRTGTTNTFTDITVLGVAKDVQPTEGVRMSEVAGDRESNDITVTVSADSIATWPVPPRKGDFVVVRGRTYAVLGAELKEVGDTSAAYVIYCRGG